jgi:uncharacterized HAD superfamily protein
MKIGIDIDEVLADYLSALIRFHNELYGTCLAPDQFKTYRFWETWGGTKEEAIQKVYDFSGTSQFKNIVPIQGAKQAIQTLRGNHTLHLITGRPDDLAEGTREWVERHFPDTFSSLNFANHFSKVGAPRTKSEICDALKVDFLIEDILDYALECVTPNRTVLLLDNPWNQHSPLPKGIRRVRSWEEIVGIIG